MCVCDCEVAICPKTCSQIAGRAQLGEHQSDGRSEERRKQKRKFWGSVCRGRRVGAFCFHCNTYIQTLETPFEKKKKHKKTFDFQSRASYGEVVVCVRASISPSTCWDRPQFPPSPHYGGNNKFTRLYVIHSSA